jgi:ElaB/YqjD/DUF883 family membrane-anchored ribosome-binding protein
MREWLYPDYKFHRKRPLVTSKKTDDERDDAEENGDETDDGEDEESLRASAAKTVTTAIRETAQKYFDAAGMKIDLEVVEDRIRDQPLISMAIAAGAGFIIGGGLATSPGIALLGLFGRTAARDTVANAGRHWQRARNG